MTYIQKLINLATEKRALELIGGALSSNDTCEAADGAEIPVIVCTDKRGVFFGYTSAPEADPITLKRARMCLYWDTKVGGVPGLADCGPTENCKISATAPSGVFPGVTAVFQVTDEAVLAWVSAPVEGR